MSVTVSESDVLRFEKKLTTPKRITYQVYNQVHERRWMTGPWYNRTEHVERRTFVIRASDADLKSAVKKAISGLSNATYYQTALSNCSQDVRISKLIGVRNWAEFVSKSNGIFAKLHSAASYPSLTVKVKPDLESIGRAGVCSCVRPSRGGLSGKFEILLTGQPRSLNVDLLAGVIAHEMLHQVGFGHRDDTYTDNNFITVFGDLVQNDGVYRQRKSNSLAGKIALTLCST